jgi:predicted SprT family Zn-dependent metalloprotease
VTVPVERYAVSTGASDEELLAACKLYARTVVASHDLTADVSDLEWRVSERAKRRAGAVHHRDGDPVRVVLTREFFEVNGWTGVAETVRHELIHVHLLNERDDPGHGDAFRKWAERLRTNVRCERFADPEWIVECEDCGCRLHRYRRSKLVKWPEKFRCGECGGDLDARSAAGRSADG